MNAPVAVLTIDELVHRASVVCDGVGQIAYALTMDVPKAQQIAAKAVSYAVDDWEFEFGPSNTPKAMLAVALLRVFDAGWEAREKRFEQGRREEALDASPRQLGG